MTTVWSLNAGQLITRAYRLIGNLSPPYVASDDQIEQGIIALNGMLKGWQSDGINLYRQEQLTMTVPAGVGYAFNPFTVTPLVMGLEQARWVVTPGANLYERPMGIFSYGDYMNLPNKRATTTSGPSVICFDKQTNQSNFYFWPLPLNGGTCNATVGRTVNDINAATDPVDFPDEWTEGAIYNLADRLMDDEGSAAADPTTAKRIEIHAAAFYQKLLNFDRPSSVFIRPWGKAGESKIWR